MCKSLRQREFRRRRENERRDPKVWPRHVNEIIECIKTEK